MARIRSIKPQFWIDEDLATLPPEARLLYIGLWNFADDGGVFEYRPARLKAQIFPYDPFSNEQITGWLDKLEAMGKFMSFSENGNAFGFLVNFPKHQSIKKPSQYRFATPPPLDSSPAVPHQFATTSPPVSLGYREEGVGSREDGVGSRVTTTTTTAGSAALSDAAKAYEENIGLLTGAIGEKLAELVDDYPDGWVIDAIKRAAQLEKRNLAYVEGILKGWKRDGRTNDNTPGRTNEKRRGDSGQDQGRSRKRPAPSTSKLVEL